MQLYCLRILPAVQARACKHLNSTGLEDFSPKASNFRCCFSPTGCVLVSGPEDDATEWSWSGEGFVCCLKSNLLQPKAPDWLTAATADLPTPKHLAPSPAELDTLRGRCAFIKCLFLDEIFDNTMLLCFSGTDAAAAWDSSACMSARPVLLSFVCYQWVWLGIRGYLGYTLKFLSNSADHRGLEGEARVSKQVSISALLLLVFLKTLLTSVHANWCLCGPLQF